MVQLAPYPSALGSCDRCASTFRLRWACHWWYPPSGSSCWFSGVLMISKPWLGPEYRGAVELNPFGSECAHQSRYLGRRPSLTWTVSLEWFRTQAGRLREHRAYHTSSSGLRLSWLPIWKWGGSMYHVGSHLLSRFSALTDRKAWL